MSDGIGKGIGEQLGQLGKQIVTDIAKVPAKITGLDTGGTDETVGQGTGGKKSTGFTQQKPPPKSAETQRIEEIVRQDEAEKQKKLAQARRLLQQFIEPQQKSVPTLQEKLEMEEMERKKKEIEEEKKKAQKQLPVVVGKRPRGDLFGMKAKKFGGEVGKNVKAQ